MLPVNVDTPATVRLPMPAIPLTLIEANVDIPVTLKLLLIVCDPVTSKVLPLNVKLPLSSISPPVPARTTRPAVKSSILNVFA